MANDVSKLQSDPAKGPQIATIAIEAPQHSRAIGDRQRDPHGRLAKIRAARDVTRTRRISGTVEFVAKPQLGDIKPKVQAAFPLPFSAFGPIFLQTCTLY